jgi:L-ascorbate metabolism protein UlaG (beta-lactamase superfamily)
MEASPLVLPDRDRRDAVGSSAEVTFIGTATVVIRCAGFTVLTDPNFLHRGQRAYVGMGLWTKRRTEPALGSLDLASVDLVVLSHHHGDHFDRRAARDLDKDVPIVTEPRAARKLRSQGFRRAVALQTWQAQPVVRGKSRLTVTSVPGKHAPEPLGSVVPSVMGSVLDFDDGHGGAFRMYVTGDTLMHDRLAEIPQRYPDIDLCIIHLGGTRIAGVLLTMDAAQGVEALRVVEPRVAVPVHYDDYGLFKSPLEDFLRQASAAGLSCQIQTIDRGQTATFAAVSRS